MRKSYQQGVEFTATSTIFARIKISSDPFHRQDALERGHSLTAVGLFSTDCWKVADCPMSGGKDQGQRTLDRTVGLLMAYPKLFNLTSMNAMRSFPQCLLAMSLT